MEGDARMSTGVRAAKNKTLTHRTVLCTFLIELKISAIESAKELLLYQSILHNVETSPF